MMEQVKALREYPAVFRLRSNRCGLNSHLRRRDIKVATLGLRGGADQTAQHFLQSGPLYRHAKQQIWPHRCVHQNQAVGGLQKIYACHSGVLHLWDKEFGHLTHCIACGRRLNKEHPLSPFQAFRSPHVKMQKFPTFFHFFCFSSFGG